MKHNGRRWMHVCTEPGFFDDRVYIGKTIITKRHCARCRDALVRLYGDNAIEEYSAYPIWRSVKPFELDMSTGSSV